MDSQLYLRIVDRKSKLVKKIDFALRRIKTGEYGYCMETGEPIGIERLIIRPTAEFCADIKYINDDQEKKKKSTHSLIYVPRKIFLLSNINKSINWFTHN